MRTWVCGVRSLLVVSLLAALPSLVFAQGDKRSFKVEQFPGGVCAVVSTDPLGLANHSNAVFIIGNDDVIVVDTQFTLARTREVLDMLRTLTHKPVSTVINTHWHDDHTFGNQVYAEAFPSAEFIAQENTREAMETIAVSNREAQVAGGEDAVALFRECVTSGNSLAGTPMSDEEKAAYTSTADIARQYLDEQKNFRAVLPTRTFKDHLALTQGTRVVELHWFGPAATRGDAVVYLPVERVLIAGDIIDNPVPFAYGCDTDGWIAALDSVAALNPAVIIPGHGEPVSIAQVQSLRASLASLRDAAREAARSGVSIEQALAGDVAAGVEKQMAGENAMLRFLCENYFIGPVMKSAANSMAN